MHRLAHRLEALRQRARRRRTKRARVMRLVLPGPGGVAAAAVLVVLVRAIEVTSRPELPFGRSAVSISNRSPSAVRTVSQLISLRTKAA